MIKLYYCIIESTKYKDKRVSCWFESKKEAEYLYNKWKKLPNNENLYLLGVEYVGKIYYE